MRRYFWLVLLIPLLIYGRTILNAQDSSERETITLPISLYLVVDDLEKPNPDISTHRTEEEMREIFAGMRDIWRQADVELELVQLGFIEVPEDILIEANRGHFDPFFEGAGTRFDIPNLSPINGFYLREIGGPNGINPLRSKTYFVMDTPSVFDRRVSSHEIGHILGLHHTLEDENRLIYPGTNGMSLSEEEIIVARYVARGILDGMR